MKYVAHLSTGRTLDVEIDGETQTFGVVDEWLLDANGVVINPRYLAALVPVIEEPADVPAIEDVLPPAVFDKDDDRWIRGVDGLYRHEQWPPSAKGRNLSALRNTFGPLKERSDRRG